MRFDGKTALITGAGAIGGIGYATAERFIDEGAKVVISGRNQEAGEEAAGALGDAATFIAADITDLDQVRTLASAAGDVDILVNNAAAFVLGGTPEIEQAGFDESFDANVRAPFFLVGALAPGMVARGNGAIISLSTMAADFGIVGMSVYGATKAALESLTRTWAAEFGPAGVRVNTIAPGPTESAKVMAVLGDGLQDLGQTTPLGRTASTAEIAAVIAFLASDDASYVTGINLAADGGRTAV